MGVQCIVPKCGHYSDKHKCHFFRVTKDPSKLYRWKRLLNISNALISSIVNPRVCSCHFPESQKKQLPIFKSEHLDYSNLKLKPISENVCRKSEEQSSSVSCNDVNFNDVTYHRTNPIKQAVQTVSRASSKIHLNKPSYEQLQAEIIKKDEPMETANIHVYLFLFAE